MSYNVAPRYSGGSPAMVDQETFERVVKQERDGWARTLEGIYGDDKKAEAEKLGLDGICYITSESRGHMWIRDEITGKHYKVPLKWWGRGEFNLGYWYKRTDRDQFEIKGEAQLTDYERRNKVYQLPVPCSWCLGTAPHCTRCHGKGTEIMEIRTAKDEEVARNRLALQAVRS